jgi:4-hydroxybenzoate polyprenyltransferase
VQFSNYVKISRLQQPTGIWLLFLPCLCGVLLALKKLPAVGILDILPILLLFLLGSVVMRSAGCVINDLIDVKIDSLVERTKNRPLAAKLISKKSALIFLFCLLTSALLILFQFNKNVVFSGFFILNFVLIYPMMKRLTYYPQIFLGLTFNFGIIMASLALLNFITPESLILYISFAIWTLIYDTIYAFQDIEDDLKIGVKSSAIAFQKRPRLALGLLNVLMLALLLYLGLKMNFNIGFFAIILLSCSIYAYKINVCDFKNGANCLRLFKQNVFFGALVAIAILIG